VRSFRLSAVATALLVCLGGALWATSAAGIARGEPTPTRSCASFDSQADAQAQFLESGGSPSHAVGDLDPDRDGVACEALPRPYAGYATIGYNRRRDFLFGVATMPARAAKGYACLTGNANEAGGIRRVHVYRGSPGSGKPLRGDDVAAAEAKPGSGRLLWKLDRASLPRGTYYVSFEGRYWPHPGGSSECPAFSSAPTELPSPRGSR
jgi:hypothetical protein